MLKKLSARKKKGRLIGVTKKTSLKKAKIKNLKKKRTTKSRPSVKKGLKNMAEKRAKKKNAPFLRAHGKKRLPFFFN